MKVTADINVTDFFINKIKALYINFSDNTQVCLNQIFDYDFSLNKTDLSRLEITNAFFNMDLLNHFVGNKKNDIVSVEYIAEGIDCIDCDVIINICCHIPCEMRIQECKYYGDYTNLPNMNVVLEGWIR